MCTARHTLSALPTARRAAPGSIGGLKINAKSIGLAPQWSSLVRDGVTHRHHLKSVAGRGLPMGLIPRGPDHDNLPATSFDHAPIPPVRRGVRPFGRDLLGEDILGHDVVEEEPAFSHALGHRLAPRADPDPFVDVGQVALYGTLG